MATQICADAIQHTSSPDDIATWVTFIDSPLQPLLSPNGLPSPAPSLIDPPPAPTHTPTPSASNLPDLQRLRYGGIAIHLRDTLFHHLAIRLPAHHAAFAGGGKPGGPAATTVKSEGTTAMLEVYARLPFALFKAVVESEQLQASDMERVRS